MEANDPRYYRFERNSKLRKEDFEFDEGMNRIGDKVIMFVCLIGILFLTFLSNSLGY